MTYGVTSGGFVKKTLPVILAEVEARQKDEIYSSLDVSSSSPLGQINGVEMAQAAELWDLAEAVYKAGDPDNNGGDGQDAVCAITGVTREAATKSYVNGALGLNDGTIVPIGSQVSVEGNPSSVFEVIGKLVGFPEGLSEVDVEADAGDGNYRARLRCTKTGPVAANAGTLTIIATPISGWNNFTADGDAVRGMDKEKNSALRARREDELFAAGSAPLDAIKADLLALQGMVSVTVFENTTLTTDANGLPGKSIECLCFDGASPAVEDEVIAQQVFDSKAGGIETYGTTGPVVAVDDDGNAHDVYFSRPVAKPVYFDIDIVVNDETFPDTGDADIEDALVVFGLDHQKVGLEVALSLYFAAVTGIAGVKKISVFRAGFAASPVGTADLTLATRELATFDTSRITINHV